MKQSNFSVLFINCILLFAGCKKESTNFNEFNFEKAKGIWVPYQYIYTDGSIGNGPFTSASIYGVYAESVQINADATFYPVIWNSVSSVVIKFDEKGTVEYKKDIKEIIFKHPVFRPDTCRLIEFSNSELWLADISGNIRKHRRQ